MNAPTLLHAPSQRVELDETGERTLMDSERRSTAPGEVTGEWSSDREGAFPSSSSRASRPSPAMGAMPGSFGDYEIVRELGRGGMGVVFEARQVSLNRIVALKLIKAGLLADDAELQRFQNEAEAVALLDHPGIVAAYEVGQHDGQHYLAMKLVRGESLSTLVEQFQREPRAIAELVAEAAEAVAHAHSRGILHRDLKPANILVDAAGHPHITDFGLAKRIESDVEMTVSGAILGTPAFMAPEQASGRRGSVTTATDIYGLGSVLYALLTGRAPFSGDTVFETLDALLTRPPDPPTRVNSKAPRDLETICLKCLEKEPKRRYDSAQALADDLRAWLESRPIAARRVGGVERAWLWCKRRPAVASLAVAVLVATIAGISTTIAVQRNANQVLRATNEELTKAIDREAKANADLSIANAQVELRYNLAMDAIKTFHTGVSEDFLLREPEFKALRDRLLQSAGSFYDQLADVLQSSSDTASKRALLASNFELAMLAEKLGRKEEALAIHRKVLAGRQALAEEQGSEVQDKVALGASQRAVAQFLVDAGVKVESRPVVEASLALHESLAREHPDAPEVLSGLASSLVVYGKWLKDIENQRVAAEDAFRRSLAIWKELALRYPDDSQYLEAQSIPLTSLSFLRADEGKYLETIEVYNQVLDVARQQLERKPGDIRIRSELATSESQMSAWYFAASQSKEATESARIASELWTAIVADEPAVPGHQVSLADSLHALGQALYMTGDLEDGSNQVREAIKLQEKLTAERPTDRRMKQSLANSHNTLGNLFMLMNRNREAESELRAALDLQKQLLSQDPADHDMRESVAVDHLNLGRLLSNSDPARAESEFLQSIEFFKQVIKEQPALIIYQMRLGVTHRFYGNLLERNGRLEEAEAQLREAVATYQRVAEIEPDAPGALNNLATEHSNLADTLRASGKVSDACEYYNKAIATREKLVEDNPADAKILSHLAWSLRRRGLAREALGDEQGCLKDTTRAWKLLHGLQNPSALELFEFACVHAQLAKLSSNRGSDGTGRVDAPEVQEPLALLRKAFEKGHLDVPNYESDRALDAIRSQTEFQQLLQEVRDASAATRR